MFGIDWFADAMVAAQKCMLLANLDFYGLTHGTKFGTHHRAYLLYGDLQSIRVGEPASCLVQLLMLGK